MYAIKWKSQEIKLKISGKISQEVTQGDKDAIEGESSFYFVNLRSSWGWFWLYASKYRQNLYIRWDACVMVRLMRVNGQLRGFVGGEEKCAVLLLVI